MSVVKNRIVQFSSVFVILGIVSLMVNNIFLLHYHILPTGEIIYHTHPYSKTQDSGKPVTNHSHTRDELTLIDLLSHPQSIETESYHFLHIEIVTELSFSQYLCSENFIEQNHPESRAPPQFI